MFEKERYTSFSIDYLLLLFIIVLNYAHMLAHTGKARMFAALVDSLWRIVCVKSGPRNYAMLRKLASTNKDTRRVHQVLKAS